MAIVRARVRVRARIGVRVRVRFAVRVRATVRIEARAPAVGSVEGKLADRRESAVDPIERRRLPCTGQG